MSRGQWTDYESFSLIELIDELKTRIHEPHRTDDFLHGMMIKSIDYYSLKDTIKEFLLGDDKKHTIKYICKDCCKEIELILTGDPLNDLIKKIENESKICSDCVVESFLKRK